ncbi:MAG: DUF4830 domain-containing protein [Clostridiaceae bacterium]
MDKKEKNSIYILSGILIIMAFAIVFIVVNHGFKQYFSNQDKKDKEFAKVETYVKNKELNVVGSSSIIENVTLPSSFVLNKDNVNIGEILKEKNEFSKKLGYDFSDDLGKKVDIIYYKLQEKNHYLIAFVNGDRIVGIWIDRLENLKNKIESEKFLNIMKTMAT